MCKRVYILNPSTCTCKNGIYLGSIIDDSVITCDEIIEVAKTDPIKTVPTETVQIKTVPTKTVPIKPVPIKTASTKCNGYFYLSFY